MEIEDLNKTHSKIINEKYNIKKSNSSSLHQKANYLQIVSLNEVIKKIF